MADALKAEGNKLFAAKQFDQAMYVDDMCAYSEQHTSETPM